MIYSFKDFLLEANAHGSNFEQQIADNVNKWLKRHRLADKLKCRRYQTVTEAVGSRDEDYSDVEIVDIDTGERNFIECKDGEKSNIVQIMFDIAEDFSLVPVEGKSRTPIEDSKVIAKIGKALESCPDYAEFIDFLQTPSNLIPGSIQPAQFLFNKVDVNERDLSKLKRLYNAKITDGKTQKNNNLIDVINDASGNQHRNMFAAAMMWRLADPKHTWDICHLKDIPYFGDAIRDHYLNRKAVPARYIQLGESGIYVFSKDDNPLRIDCSEFPKQVSGQIDLKFTPRNLSSKASIHITSRSKVTSKILLSNSSFDNEKRFPSLLADDAVEQVPSKKQLN